MRSTSSGGQSGDEIQWLEQHMGGAIPEVFIKPSILMG
jgi:hypothetical protein